MTYVVALLLLSILLGDGILGNGTSCEGFVLILPQDHQQLLVTAAPHPPTTRTRRTTRPSLRTVLRSCSTSHLEESPSSPFEYSAEVVGATGRMGSFWLCLLELSDYHPIAVPRGVAPGYQSQPGTPILVATPSMTWDSIRNSTAMNRQSDLVWLGNGIPVMVHDAEGTWMVPHYSVLQTCRRQADISSSSSSSTMMSKWVGTSPESPPTILYGKYAAAISRLLETAEVQTQVVNSIDELRLAAAWKVMWASCFWLLCHSNNDANDHAPLTVGQVHDQRSHDLERLVEELLDPLEHVLQDMSSTTTPPPNAKNKEETKETILKYFERYSRSISNAIPSKDLGIAELSDRNGLWLAHDPKVRDSAATPSQPYHQSLLRQVVGPDFWSLLTEVRSKVSDTPDSRNHYYHLSHNYLTVSGAALEKDDAQYWPASRDSDQTTRQQARVVTIVGGGILGTAMAVQLARQCPSDWSIRLIDSEPESSFGLTTAASWAWLNANDKRPRKYQQLNQLGLHTWKHDPLLSSLVDWTGSLVRYCANDMPDFIQEGGYAAEGPLSKAQIHALEPLANWTLEDGAEKDAQEQGKTYHFPEEGSVDPRQAIAALRQEAQRRSVSFVFGHTVTAIQEGMDGRISSVVTEPSTSIRRRNGDTGGTEPTTAAAFPTDLVVVAAGIGASSPIFGSIPLLERPGQIAFARPSTEQTDESNPRLSKILVDPARHSHVMQRRDGTIVAGGGVLEVGGVSSTSTTKSTDLPTTGATTHDESILASAVPLAPAVVRTDDFSHEARAIRPMPLDGLPVMGYVQPGIYTMVTHSGMTLGPILASLAALEICQNIKCDLLSSYRPSRFHTAK